MFREKPELVAQPRTIVCQLSEQQYQEHFNQPVRNFRKAIQCIGRKCCMACVDKAPADPDSNYVIMHTGPRCSERGNWPAPGGCPHDSGQCHGDADEPRY